MATITGKDGSVTFPNSAGAKNTANEKVVHITEWAADISRDIHDVTEFDDTTAEGNRRVKLGGQMRLKGTATGILNTSGMPAPLLKTDDGQPTAGFVLQQLTGDTYSFSALVTNIQPAVDRRGLATCTLAFSSSGTVTVTA